MGAAAKHKAARAGEDNWLYDGDDGCDTHGLPSDEEDGGLTMLDLQQANSAASARRSSEKSNLKVTNLIDWGECNIADEELSTGIGLSSSSNMTVVGSSEVMRDVSTRSSVASSAMAPFTSPIEVMQGIAAPNSMHGGEDE